MLFQSQAGNQLMDYKVDAHQSANQTQLGHFQAAQTVSVSKTSQINWATCFIIVVFVDLIAQSSPWFRANHEQRYPWTTKMLLAKQKEEIVERNCLLILLCEPQIEKKEREKMEVILFCEAAYINY